MNFIGLFAFHYVIIINSLNIIIHWEICWKYISELQNFLNYISFETI